LNADVSRSLTSCKKPEWLTPKQSAIFCRSEFDMFPMTVFASSV
jgi:hypothetical protein